MKATKIKDQKTLDRTMSDFCLLENKHVELTTEMESRLQSIRDKYASRLEAIAMKSARVTCTAVDSLPSEPPAKTSTHEWGSKKKKVWKKSLN